MYNLSDTSLVKTLYSDIPEIFIPIWMADGSFSSATNVGSGHSFIAWGGNVDNTSLPGQDNKLITIPSDYPPDMLYALHSTLKTSGPTAQSGNIALWDCVTNTVIPESQLTSNSSTYVLLTSSKFKLIPGRTYAVTIWSGVSSSYSASMPFCGLIAYAQ